MFPLKNLAPKGLKYNYIYLNLGGFTARWLSRSKDAIIPVLGFPITVEPVYIMRWGKSY